MNHSTPALMASTTFYLLASVTSQTSLPENHQVRNENPQPIKKEKKKIVMLTLIAADCDSKPSRHNECLLQVATCKFLFPFLHVCHDLRHRMEKKFKT